MDKQKIEKELLDIISTGLAADPLPYVQNNSIRIGKIVITPKSDGYSVYDLSIKSRVGKTYSKNAALALARASTKKLHSSAFVTICELDKEFAKYDIDCQFYGYTLNKSKDRKRQAVAEIRYSDAYDRKTSAAEKLNKFIF